ncbi:MAG: HEAT repeat domain-containing protein [Acidobacteriota bacterium]
MTNHRKSKLLWRIAGIVTVVTSCVVFATLVVGQESTRLTPVQREIERQRQRLGSLEVEERRDALMRLANLKRPEASRAAAAALNDSSPTVRVAAAHAIISLPNHEAAALLLPLLKDKSEFVRREVVFALGATRHSSAGAALVELLNRDKEPSVRAATAIALGEIGDPAVVPSLSHIIAGEGSKKTKSKGDEEEFVVRSAVRSLGQIGSGAAVPILIGALQDESNSIDTRREAAIGLGRLGDAAALPALHAAFQANADPYLSEAARIAVRQINRTKVKGAGN